MLLSGNVIYEVTNLSKSYGLIYETTKSVISFLCGLQLVHNYTGPVCYDKISMVVMVIHRKKIVIFTTTIIKHFSGTWPYWFWVTYTPYIKVTRSLTFSACPKPHLQWWDCFTHSSLSVCPVSCVKKLMTSFELSEWLRVLFQDVSLLYMFYISGKHFLKYTHLAYIYII